MDIPFLSSTAINRDHYHLVRSVEAAITNEQIDAILVHKVELLQSRFSRKKVLSLSDCSYALIVLLYCWFTSTGHVKRESLEFALPQAVNLAEAGTTIQQKRIGYTFCFLLMDGSHELQLMLVNTLRKDIESSEFPRICLALDALIMNCPTDALPAVISRLTDLLGHHSSLVKSKALIVMRNVSRDDPHFWTVLSDQLSVGLSDPDSRVVTTILRVMQDLMLAGIINPTDVAKLLLDEFPSVDTIASKNVKLSFTKLLSHVISSLVNNETNYVKKLLDILFDIMDTLDSQRAVILECFRIFPRVPPEILLPYFQSQEHYPFRVIVESMDGRDPNAMYFCLACLENVDAKFWAGNTDEFPAIFSEVQVNTIMDFLQSPDHVLRLKVLRTLNMVDKTILLGYLTQLMLNIPSAPQFQPDIKAIEVASIYEEEGQPFAVRLKDVCSCLAVSLAPSEKHHERNLNKIGVSQGIIEVVLLHLRTVSDSFKGDFVDEIMRTPLSEIGSTLSLIISATTYEYGHLSSLPPSEQLRKLVDLVKVQPAAIQEPLLLAMLRITAREGAVPPDVIERVNDLYQLSKSLIKKRCKQFSTFSNDMSRLRDILDTHKCDTLPEFLVALESTEKHGESMYASGPYRDDSRVVTSPPVSKGKLRYEAYEAPRPTPKQSRPRNLSRDTSFISSPRDVINTPSTLTLSPGHLALAVYEVDLSKRETQFEQSQIQEHTGDDLITLDSDSPFLVDPIILPENSININADTENFDTIWQTLKDCPSTRGWSEREIDQIAAPFRSVYKGEYDVRVYHLDKEIDLAILSLPSGPAPSSTVLAAIRLRPGEEGTTLWQMRCPDASLRAQLKSQCS